jgi:nickel-type superoxide dismutase maturation protease
MFGYNIYKVNGKSMEPKIGEESFIFSIPYKTESRKKSIFVISHKKYGLLIKKLKYIDENSNHWFVGENDDSISSEKIGPIKKSEIIGKAFLLFSKDFFLFKLV